MRLKTSPFLHQVSVDDYVALYNSLSLELAFIREDFLANHLRDGFFIATDEKSRQTLGQLRELGLLIGEQEDGWALYKQYRRQLEKPAINILYLLLTDACNFRCRYCYFLAPFPKNHLSSWMSSGTVIRALDFFARCVKKSITEGRQEQHVVIYGGEPTLNKRALITALNYIDYLKKHSQLPESLSVTINTNGVLLDEEILAQCQASGAIVSISIDGPEEINDQMRVDSTGQGTFRSTIRAYHLARRLKVKTGVCVTVDQHNLAHLEDIVRWVGEKLGATGMGFNILIEDLRPQSARKKDWYAKAVAQKLISSFKVARDLGIYEDRMMRRVKGFLEKETTLSDCGGCGLQAVISPNGEIGVCQAFWADHQFFVQEPLEVFEPEQHEFWRQWRKRSPLTNDDCLDCIALGNCGGGCPYNAYRATGHIEALDERFCVHARETTYFLIRDLWDQEKQKIVTNRG